MIEEINKEERAPRIEEEYGASTNLLHTIKHLTLLTEQDESGHLEEISAR